MTALVAQTTLLAPERAERKSFYHRFWDALIQSRARAAAREILRYHRRTGWPGHHDEASLAHELAAIYRTDR